VREAQDHLGRSPALSFAQPRPRAIAAVVARLAARSAVRQGDVGRALDPPGTGRALVDRLAHALSLAPGLARPRASGAVGDLTQP
jgi:hypothetical protein